MEKRKVSWFYENRFVIGAFLLTAILMCVTYILREVYPFGDRIVLKVDLYHQYAPFHEELRSRILNGQSLLYSWEGGLGKEFVTQMAYYTASPISFLILLFPQHLLPEALAFFILFKTALTSAFFTYYLKEHFKKNDFTILIFGLLYGFTAFMTGYYWNVMWLDSVALFPLVALGVERLIDENKHIFYFVTLTLTMIVNFYMAVLVCVFTAAYFMVVLFANYSWKENKSLMIHRMVKFGIVSIIAALTSMFILAPVAIALGQTATSQTNFPKFEVYKNVYQIIANHFIGSRPVVLARNEDLPNIYSGVITMMLLPLYFFNKEIKKSEKYLLSALLIFMILCACIKPLDFMIHGFHFPSNLPHRYTFIYSFVLLYMGYKGFLNIKSCDFMYVVYTAIFYVVVILITEFLVVPNISDIDRALTNSDIIINIVAIIVYLAIIYSYKNAKPDIIGGLVGIIFICVFAECMFSSFEGLDRTTPREDYVKFIDGTKSAIEYMDKEQKDNSQDGFYRTEFRRFTTINDASLYHYNGFSQFSSLAPGGISEFIGNLGVAATGNSYRYYDPTALIDAMFNLEYIMNKDGEIVNDRYEFEAQFDNVWVYRNNRALPLGFLVDTDVKNWVTEDSMPFDVQNDFIKKSTGINEDMFSKITPTSIEKTHLEVKEEIDESSFKYRLTSPANLALEPTVTATFVSDKDQYMYVYVDAGNAKRVKYQNDTQNQDRELSAGKSLFDIGYVKKGEVITVSFALTNKGEFEKTYRKDGTVKIYGASYNAPVFEKAYNILSQRGYQIDKFEDTYIEGRVVAEKDSLLFTSIPYVDGWKVSVDGKEVEKVSIAKDGVIGVNIPEGEHKVVFEFKSKGLIPAVLISIVGLILIFVYTIFDNKLKTKKNYIMKKAEPIKPSSQIRKKKRK